MWAISLILSFLQKGLPLKSTSKFQRKWAWVVSKQMRSFLSGEATPSESIYGHADVQDDILRRVRDLERLTQEDVDSMEKNNA